eukprot:3959768-Pyramimonas_sp.AAC.1
MAMEVTVTAPPSPQERGYCVWDWGLIAAGLQIGHARREFLTDLHGALQQAAPILDTIIEDDDPTRHAAVVSHIIRTTAMKYYSKDNSTPQWVQYARVERLTLLRQRACLREQGAQYDSAELKEVNRNLK